MKSERELIELERSAARIRMARAFYGTKDAAPALLNPIPWIRRYPWATVAIAVVGAGAAAFWIWRKMILLKMPYKDLRHDPLARQYLKTPPPQASWTRRIKTSLLRRARNTLFGTLLARLVWGATGRPPQDYATADPYARWE